MKSHYNNSAELRDALRQETGGKMMLSFSRGKDAVAAWLALRESRIEVIPVFLYIVPGLQFVENDIAYFEDYFSTKIIQLPHPGYLRAIDKCMYQPPHRIRQFEQLRIHRKLNYRDIFDGVAAEYGCSEWYATGVRQADSMTRRAAINKSGSAIMAQKKAHVVYDWSVETMDQKFTESSIKLSPEYVWFGRSYDGLGIEYIHAIKQYAPNDYETILRYFPLIEAEVANDEFRRVAQKS